ncbi:hypothetical protein L6R50_05625 [Myxococcota bacterium]|nr:hypothetical protein [Myxococcota bacterium]
MHAPSSPHRPIPLALAALAALLAGACDDGAAPDDDSAPDAAPDLTGLPDDADSDPRIPGHPLLPWPSDFFVHEDPATPNGLRITLPQGALPATDGNVPDTAPYNLRDGFSPIGPMLATFANGVDPGAVPTPDGASVADDAPVLVLDLDTGERISYLAELDAGADGDPAHQALILRPLRRMTPGHRIAVAVRDLAGADGQPVAVSDAFRALRDGLSTDSSTVEGLRPDAERLFARLEELGIARADLRLAWDFTVVSESLLDQDMIDLADVVLSRTGSWNPAISLDIHADGELGPYRVIRGSITVPWFLDAGDRLVRDAEGRMVPQGEQAIGFRLTVPETASGTRPILLFGHGLFGSDEEIEDPKTNPLAHTWGLPFIATSYVGVTEIDAARAYVAVQNFDDFVVITDRVHQGTANFLSLARFAREELPGILLHDDVAGTPGEPVVNGDLVYTGISLGGCVGGAYMALDPEVERGLLVVPGGGWVHMFEHSSNWDGDPASLSDTFAESVPDPADRQVLIAALSLLFDPVDQFNFVHRLTQDPFDWNAPKTVGVHMVRWDSQVPNFTTEILARNIGLPQVSPAPYSMYGIDEVAATPESPYQGSGAVLSYELPTDPLPPGNTPPSYDNGVHQEVRATDAFRTQAGHFLWNGGETVQVCEGICDPE